MAARPPPSLPLLDEFDIPGRPDCVTVYMSPLCPELRTRAWIEFLGFPRHLWSQHGAAACLVTFGGVTHLDEAAFRRAGRMVVEARVARVAEVPRRVNVMESVQVPGGMGMGFVCHHVRLVVLSAEPVFEEEGSGKKKMKTSSTTADEQAGGNTAFAAEELGESEVGTEEQPESVDCYLSRWTI